MSLPVDESGLPEGVLEELRRLPAVDPAARDRLRVALAGQHRPRGTIVLSPLQAALAACALVVATSLVWIAGTSGVRVSAHRDTAMAARDGGSVIIGAGLTPVQFVLVAPEARSVALVGDFNAWTPDASLLTPGEGGVWSIVVPLTQGTFAYSFIVDGAEWRADPRATLTTDDFGRPSSLLYVSPET